jgi:hypothetical protein
MRVVVVSLVSLSSSRLARDEIPYSLNTLHFIEIISRSVIFNPVDGLIFGAVHQTRMFG